MPIEWENCGPTVSEDDVDEFEALHHVRFSKEHRRFLIDITNGGSTKGEEPIPTQNCPGGAGGLAGVFGIHHQASYFDMATALRLNEDMLPYLIPFGYDAVNGQLHVDMVNPPGRLVYVPWEELGNVPLAPYHVANSIAEFLEELPKLAAEFEDDSS
jgi:hypothetical protein